MKEQVFRYYKGEENIVVVEKGNYEESLFREQYIQALKQVTDHVEHPKDNVPNLITFCGDRGEGKTSCMMTVNHIITNIHEERIAKEIKDLGIDVNKIKEAAFTTMPIIDPAFFDKEHNIIELLLGHLYKKFKDWSKVEENQKLYGATNEVAKLFHKTKTCLMHIEQSKVAMYDPLEELEVLSAGVELSECISRLIERYLGLVGKKKLLICIDDIDLNMSRAYRMCEEIRKYLNNRHCLILMSVKIDQLIEAIENDIHKEADFPKGIDFSGMASKYVAKLIPVSVRVNMPQVYDLCDYKLEVYDGGRNKAELVFPSQSVKNGVVRKIFATCRFLFYNSKGSVSPIVPNNLRNLTQLLSLLFSMTDIDEVESGVTEVLEKNKHLFKAYFYKTWVKQLEPENQKFAEDLTTRQDGSDLNKYVVSYLTDKLKRIKADNDLIRGITDSANFSYNISIGDVLYLISYMEQSSFEEEVKNVLFFIKSFYSIRLFEKYDVVTNDIENELYPENKETGNLYRADVLFDHTNVLQRAVAGSYFSYMSKELLSPERETGQIRDFKVINGKGGLNVLLSNVIKVLRSGRRESMTSVEVEAFDLRFRLAEYFMLAVSRSVLGRDIPAAAIPPTNRKEAKPFYLTSFNSSTGYYVFDILNPFYALTNPQYAYGRFDDIAVFWEYAEKYEWSLLRQMMNAVREKELVENKILADQQDSYYPIADNIKYWKQRLLSNSIIRNTEVALAVMENSRNNKVFNRRTGESRLLIADFYTYIINTNMMTYNRGENEKPYYINFDFLSPIVVLLKDGRINESLSFVVGNDTLNLPTFNQIYNFVGKDKKAKRNSSIAADLFAESFKRYKPTGGNNIISRIKNNQSELYGRVLETEWENWFDKDTQYTKEQVFEILQQHIHEFAMVDVLDDDEV